MALAPKKGKGASEPDGDEAPDSDDDASEDYEKLFVDAAKDGDWAAAFAAVCAYVDGH